MRLIAIVLDITALGLAVTARGVLRLSDRVSGRARLQARAKTLPRAQMARAVGRLPSQVLERSPVLAAPLLVVDTSVTYDADGGPCLSVEESAAGLGAVLTWGRGVGEVRA